LIKSVRHARRWSSEAKCRSEATAHRRCPRTGRIGIGRTVSLSIGGGFAGGFDGEGDHVVSRHLDVLAHVPSQFDQLFKPRRREVEPVADIGHLEGRLLFEHVDELLDLLRGRYVGFSLR